jgi:hypothetical protein
MTSRFIFCTSLLTALALAGCVQEKQRVTPDGGSSPDLGGGTCTGAPTATEDTVAMCNDGCDNDGNGFADCNDHQCCGVRTNCPAGTACGTDAGPVTTCVGPATPENTADACSDNCDNDANGFVDCFDYACCGVRTDCAAGTTCGDIPPATVVTIEQIQNAAATGHPAVSSRVTVNQTGMVALTPRVVIGSAMSNVATRPVSPSCRFGIWVGSAVSGDYTAIHVQELIPLPVTTASCFDLPDGKISSAFAPGDAVTSINNATYTEFCAGATGTPLTACANFEQSNIFLGGTATIVRGAAGTAPTGTVVTVADLAAAAGAPGTRTLALEGGLLTIEGAQMRTTPDTGIYFRYSAFVPSATTVELDILVSNFPNAQCVRDHFTALAAGTTTMPSVTGVLVPNYGRWMLRLRSEADVEGLVCP